MILRVKLINHIKSLYFFLVTMGLLIVVLLFLKIPVHVTILSLLGYFVFTLPAFILHFIYYVKNKGQEIEITADSIVQRAADEANIEYKLEELEKIVLYKAASLESGVTFSSLESYHFARVIPKQGKNIIITCLIAPDVETTVRSLRGVPIEKKRNIFTIP